MKKKPVRINTHHSLMYYLAYSNIQQHFKDNSEHPNIGQVQFTNV